VTQKKEGLPVFRRKGKRAREHRVKASLKHDLIVAGETGERECKREVWSGTNTLGIYSKRCYYLSVTYLSSVNGINLGRRKT